MTPLLEAIGGYFRYDFTIDQTLKGATDPAINRLFVISFPDKPASEKFFKGPAYVAAKKEFFESSVDLIRIISEYECPGSRPGE